VWKTFSSRRWSGYFAAFFGIAAVTGVLKLFGGRINSTTVALALLLVVLFVATAWGSRPAIVASLLGVVCFNFFYLPPIGKFTIDAPDNWIALVAFLVTAVTAGHLSARAKRQAKEANASRLEVERLYHELQDTFERSSQAQALKQSEQLKSALLDAVTHDLRTPLTSIKASVTTLLEELKAKGNDEESVKLDAEGHREMLEVIDEEADRLDRFIEGLMELARIEAGEMHLRKQWGSVEEIIQAALRRAAPLTRGHRMEVWLDDDLPSVKVDERAVTEVIYTLVDNAAKYSAAGTSIRIEAKSSNDGTVQLLIADEGPGIPAPLRERVFDKFFRAMRNGDSSGNKSAGSGMGLAIAKGIVEAHGGRIWIEDARGDPGTKMVVVLPTGD
jgi:K+-sensing histidine kinase KdpD